jgi:hypothetical protein
MGTKQTSVRKAMPFELLSEDGTKKRLSWQEYLQLAHQHLVTTIESYKSSFGKSGVD